jgi:DNA helicase HerA-like ATPase
VLAGPGAGDLTAGWCEHDRRMHAGGLGTRTPEAGRSPGMTATPQTDEHALAEGLARFRDLRRRLEEAVLPLATSLDGRRFVFQASLHGLELRLGGYVMVESGDLRRLGQVLDLELELATGAEMEMPAGDDAAGHLRGNVTLRVARGAGALLEGDDTPFHDALVRPATPEEVRSHLERTRRPRAQLEIGDLALAPGVPARLDAGGFDRHTFLCGQSGSGKTYSLGVVLERLLLETGLRIVVLDPNSDYVRLHSVRDGVDSEIAGRYGEAVRGLAVHSARAAGAERLRFRLADIGPAAQAALLRLDPIDDREEHAELTQLLADDRPLTVAAMAASERVGVRRLAMRAHNLGVERFGIWARSDPGPTTLESMFDPETRGVIVDLGSLGTPEEQALTAEAVLGELWRRREERRPVLIVIDEAHNVCPAHPEDRLTALATEHAVRIAAEGRKFGLYLMVSTQRPQKVHENVISQCDNLVLMRLNSAADAAFAMQVFSFVPPRLIEKAAGFGLGEALVAGKISPNPALVRFGARVAEEGGSDVPATWAAPAG